MNTRKIVFSGLGLYVLGMIVLIVIFGGGTKNDAFKPQNEFYLVPWINLPGSFDITKGVLYLFIATALTTGTMLYVANRMQARPNRVQTAVEVMYGFTRDQITRGAMDEDMAKKWFPFLATIFFFILFNNLIGYIPLPTNSLEKVNIFGLEIPAFAIFAATANVSIPLVLALMVFIAYNVEGIRKKGLIGYLKALIPQGVEGGMAAFIFVLEFMSNFMRLISLTVRLFANILAGHLIILFMSGGLAVLLGMEAVGWLTLPIGVAIYLFEVGLVAALQAFIFATLSAIYLGGAVADHH
ncbi:MAG: F-type H+-transporting ATPase subunit a [Solirubrobacteraceae bacterium]|nr:F-type H+-transporting ATPase subunit a [Solirubrobacteraceae bacterium]